MFRLYRRRLLADYRLSDDHTGQQKDHGYPHDRQVHTPFPGGLAAVWAPRLTREALFDALRNRRCYGTTGARIILQFSLDDQPMGSILTGYDRERARELVVDVMGTDGVARIEIVRDGKVALVERPLRARDAVGVHWRDETPLAASFCYYVRVVQVDGQRAWSSPIWVETSPTA